MTAADIFLIGVGVANVALGVWNVWASRVNERQGKANLENAEELMRSAHRLNEMSKLAGDLHRARMSVYSAVEAHLRAMGED